MFIRYGFIDLSFFPDPPYQHNRNEPVRPEQYRIKTSVGVGIIKQKYPGNKTKQETDIIDIFGVLFFQDKYILE